METSSFAMVRNPEQLLGPLAEAERRDAPPLLYLAGDPGLLWGAQRVAVVGSRKPSDNGRRRAARLACGLVDAGVTVVSGLSAGIDTVAHETAIQQLGRTIAVLATPLDAWDARSADLKRRIMEGHLAISQFPSGHPHLRSNAGERHWTLALVSDAAVIVEASDASACLEVGWEMLRLERPLFIPKPLVEAAALRWPRALVDRGAMVLDGVEGLLAELRRRSWVASLRLAS
jgi:DNA processing protein